MPIAKWGFFVWMILHMAGGSLTIGETRLYDLILVPIVGAPYDILKYDQFVHFYCYVVYTFLMFSVVKAISRPDPHRFAFSLVLVLAATSVGALNEIVEFGAVVFYGSTGVGGYYNTGLDLIMNLLGSLLAVMLLQPRIRSSPGHASPSGTSGASP
jgi:putative membrane protein